MMHATFRRSQSIGQELTADGRMAATQVSQADSPVPVDGELHELKVEAVGYQVWSISLRGETRPGRVLYGPVRLKQAGQTG